MNDPSIQSLAAQLTAGLTSEWYKAKAVFNWVRGRLTTASFIIQGMVLLELSGIVLLTFVTVHILWWRLQGRRDCRHAMCMGFCTFSSGTYGHVWAQIYVNGKWYNADATSTRNSLGVVNSWNTVTATILGVYVSLPF